MSLFAEDAVAQDAETDQILGKDQFKHATLEAVVTTHQLGPMQKHR